MLIMGIEFITNSIPIRYQQIVGMVLNKPSNYKFISTQIKKARSVLTLRDIRNVNYIYSYSNI